MRPPSLLRCAAAALALAAASGCGWFQSALQVHVTVDPLVRATCVQVDLFTSPDISGEPTERRLLARPAGKDDFIVGIYRGGLPSQVFVTARPMFGVECANLVLNGAPVVTSGTFPPSGFTPVDLALMPPPPADDADGDGFVHAPNGADCNDGDPAVNPGATEHCNEAADFNCNALIGCADPACSGTSCLASPTQLTFASLPQTLTAGACSAAVQVDTAGAGGAVLAAVVPVTVSFSAPDGNLTIYSDAACTAPVGGVTILSGRSRATVYVKGTTAGAAHLSAGATGLTSTQQTETVVPGAAVSLVFTSAAQTTAPLYGCSQPVTLELRDAFGNATPVGTPLNIALAPNASPSSTFKFYPDAACQNAAIVQTPVAAGGTGATFYFKSTASAEGTVTITATAGALTATQSEGLVFRAAARLVFPLAAVTAVQNVCSPAVTLQTQDTSGNPAPVLANLTIGLSASSGSLVFYRDAACATSATSVTLTAGLSSVVFYFKGNQGTPQLTASGGVLGSPQQTETITAPQPTQLAFATAAQTVSAGACSGAVNVDARDASGTPTAVLSATTVTLSTNPSGQVTLYSDSACTTASGGSAVMATGSSRVTVYFKGTLAASTDLTASAGGLTSTPAQTETVTAAAGTKVLIVAAGKNQTVAAGTCASLTLERQDPYGNATTGALETMTLSSTPSAGMAFYGSSGCTSAITSIQLPAASARVFLYFKGTATGSYTLSEAPQSSLTGDTAPETITSGTPAELRFTSASQVGVAAGSCSAVVTVATYDGNGNPANVSGNTTVNVGTTGSTGATLYSDAACTTVASSVTIAANSGSTNFYFKGTLAGSGTLTAGAGGLTSAAPQSFAIIAGPPAKLGFSLGPATATAGICSGAGNAIQVQIQDQYGNPSNVTATTTVNISASNGTAATMLLSFNQNCNGSGLTSFTISSGSNTSATIYFKTTGSGTWTVTVTSSGLTTGTQNETVNPDVPNKLFFVTGVQTVTHDQCSQPVTVQIQDQYGNPSPPAADQSITLQGTTGFFKNAACNQAITPASITVTAGQTDGSFYFKAPAATGSYTITISSSGLTSANQMETIN